MSDLDQGFYDQFAIAARFVRPDLPSAAAIGIAGLTARVRARGDRGGRPGLAGEIGGTASPGGRRL